MTKAFAFAVALVGLAGCTSSSPPAEGTYTVAWTLVAPATCAASEIADVLVTVTDEATNESRMVSAPCEAGTVTTAAMPIGSHTITLAAMGTAGDVAGEVTTEGTLVKNHDAIVIPTAAIAVLPPTTREHTTWTLARGGAAIECGEITGQDGVQITVTSPGVEPEVDFWDCTEANATVDVPYGDFTVHVDVVDQANAILASSDTVAVPAGRGVLETAVAVVAP